jgi:3-deoxy-D-manno-octulosonic-acid transferase
MQTTADADRFVAAGARENQVITTGNFKMDGVSEGSTHGLDILREAGLAGRPLLIGASTHPSEEEFLLRVFRHLRTTVPTLLLLLAPRHPQRFPDVEQLLVREEWRYRKRSQSSQATVKEAEVFLLDTLGELSSFYRAATLTFVGGSLVKGPGGHSVVEPALSRTPVCFGPYTWNFSPIVEQLVQAGGGFEVRQEDDFNQQALPLFTDPHRRQEVGRRAYEVVKQGQGAVQRTMAVVLETLRPLGFVPTMNR